MREGGKYVLTIKFLSWTKRETLLPTLLFLPFGNPDLPQGWRCGTVNGLEIHEPSSEIKFKDSVYMLGLLPKLLVNILICWHLNNPTGLNKPHNHLTLFAVFLEFWTHLHHSYEGTNNKILKITMKHIRSILCILWYYHVSAWLGFKPSRRKRIDYQLLPNMSLGKVPSELTPTTTTLDLSFNLLFKLQSSDFCFVSKLKVLILCHNKIQELDIKTFGFNKELKYLICLTTD